MLWQAAFTASWLVAQAHAGIGMMAAEGILAVRGPLDMEQRMDLIARDGTQPQPSHHAVVRRQSSPDIVLNQDGTINMTAWETVANAACNDALLKLPESTNPSGTCICYNLPALDNQTGTFEADLRLYQLSTPSGQFSGIPPQNIQVGLSYNGASVSPVSAKTAQRIVGARQALPAATMSLKLLQTYLFVGQIDKGREPALMNSAQLEALVMPTVTLTAVNASGQMVSTNVSSNEAAFVVGVFSREVIMSEFAVAQAAVDIITKNMADGSVAFVMPGVQFMIFPIGLVVTGIWLILGLVAYGIGTYERISYREQFRRRTALAANKGSGRI